MNTTSIEPAMLRQGIARDHPKSGFFSFAICEIFTSCVQDVSACGHEHIEYQRPYKTIPFTVTVQELKIEDECTKLWCEKDE